MAVFLSLPRLQAFTFNDQMIDMPTMLQCQSVLAMARKIGKVLPKDE